MCTWWVIQLYVAESKSFGKVLYETTDVVREDLVSGISFMMYMHLLF